MNHGMGTFLFAAAIVGNGVMLVAGLAFGLVTLVRRAIMSIGTSPAALARKQASLAFHHVDHIQTPIGEWIFMAFACLTVLVGLPVVIAALFQFGLPALGRFWNHG